LLREQITRAGDTPITNDSAKRRWRVLGAGYSRRAAGFRLNKLLQHWEGRARLADAEALANTHGGWSGVLSSSSRPPRLPAKAGTSRRPSEISGFGAFDRHHARACRQFPPVRDRRRAEAQMSAITLYRIDPIR